MQVTPSPQAVVFLVSVLVSVVDPASQNQLLNQELKLEARAGIEPAHRGFADLGLTTWLPRPHKGAHVAGKKIAPQVLKSSGEFGHLPWPVSDGTLMMVGGKFFENPGGGLMIILCSVTNSTAPRTPASGSDMAEARSAAYSTGAGYGTDRIAASRRTTQGFALYAAKSSCHFWGRGARFALNESK